MKILKITLFKNLVLAVSLLFLASSLWGQIEFEGFANNGEGGAGWNADGSGPEPYGNGHADIYYYGATVDYVEPTSTHGAHGTDIVSGFPLFEQALIDHGYDIEQVTVSTGLSSLGDDIEGVDWWNIGTLHYMTFYPSFGYIKLDGEPILEFTGDYNMWYKDPAIGDFWNCWGAYSQVKNVATPMTTPFQVAQALIHDIGDNQVRVNTEMHFTNYYFSGNGRSGLKYDIYLSMEIGNPEMHGTGLASNHQGLAGWDADGTGPEPQASGHLSMAYYTASRDYDDIDPDPNAALFHFTNNSQGFYITEVQMQYRGYTGEDMRVKMGLNSLGPDVEGQDWGYNSSGNHWCNYYNNTITLELAGEPIIIFLLDTNQTTSNTGTWNSISSFGKAYNISENATANAQFVAESFMRDIGSRSLSMEGITVSASGIINSNGRSGGFYSVMDCNLVGTYENITYIDEEIVSGEWTSEGSPYYIDGNIYVENGQTLEIDAGTEIYVRGPYRFDVQGCVKAMGTDDEKVLFSRSNPNLMWDGFDFNATDLSNDSSVFDHCIFEYAYAQGAAPNNSGGAIVMQDFDKALISNSLFQYNKADIPIPLWTPSGGAIALDNASPFISKCIFRFNQATSAGAIISYDESNAIISNCLFYENISGDEGGALEYHSNSNGLIINSTIVDNEAYIIGGGIHMKYGSSPQIINTIIWNNTAGEGNQVGIVHENSNPEFYYCDIEGGLDEIYNANYISGYENNIEEDPVFMQTPENFYSLEGGSPCIDAGTPSSSPWYYEDYLPLTCLCGNPRTWGLAIDIGAFEHVIEGIDDPLAENKSNFKLYPNPSSDIINVFVELDNSSDFSMKLYNGLGSQVKTIESTRLAAGQHTITYNINDLPEGIYFCRMSDGKEVKTIKLIKTN
jgi:hypothetical protein